MKLSDIIKEFKRLIDKEKCTTKETLLRTYTPYTDGIVEFHDYPESVYELDEDKIQHYITRACELMAKEIVPKEIDSGDLWNPADPSMGKEIGFNQCIKELEQNINKFLNETT